MKKHIQIRDFLNDLGYNMYWLAVPTYNSNNHKQNTQNVFGPNTV